MLPVQIYYVHNILEQHRENVIHRQNIERRILRDTSDPFSLNDTLFINTFRLTKDMVNFICNRLIPYMRNSNHPNAVSPVLKIFCALNFYATGAYQRHVGQQYLLSVCQRSVSVYVKEISQLIIEHLAEEFIKFPATVNEKQRIKIKFMEKTRFPGVIGCIDCTHVSILTPSEVEHNYLNRKGYHSKNVQIICDYDLKILNINARYAGASHDSYIWRRSNIRQELEQCFQNGERNTWLLGDCGYPLEPWLMTPVLNAAEGSAQEGYNARHSAARNCVERCNGVLKTRFRCIMGERVLRYTPEKAGFIIIACAVLHNMCINARLEFDILPQVDENCENNARNNEPNIFERNYRDQLIERYFQN